MKLVGAILVVLVVCLSVADAQPYGMRPASPKPVKTPPPRKNDAPYGLTYKSGHVKPKPGPQKAPSKPSGKSNQPGGAAPTVASPPLAPARNSNSKEAAPNPPDVANEAISPPSRESPTKASATSPDKKAIAPNRAGAVGESAPIAIVVVAGNTPAPTPSASATSNSTAPPTTDKGITSPKGDQGSQKPSPASEVPQSPLQQAASPTPTFLRKTPHTPKLCHN